MPKRILLHLDDGSVVCTSDVLDPNCQQLGAVKLSIEKAVELQRQSKRVVENLEGIVDRLKKAGYRVPEPSLARPYVAPSKKARPAATPAPARAVEWVSTCQEVLKKVLKALGADRDTYYNPVKPAILPDYYRIVPKPIFLSDIERKLDQGDYSVPQEFVEDMRQHWINVKLYNPQGDPFRKLGEKVEEIFENLWASTGLATGGERARRATAGHMPSKFDPEAYDDPPAKPSASRQRTAKTPRASGAPARTASHEVSSGGRARAQPQPQVLSVARKHEIAAYLQELPEEHAEHLMTLLPQDLLRGIESGELELDFEALDEATLQRIDAWMQELYLSEQDQQQEAVALPQAPASPPHSQPGVRVDQYSDEDYQAEDDSDSE